MPFPTNEVRLSEKEAKTPPFEGASVAGREARNWPFRVMVSSRPPSQS
jgi:hypothetical protein